MKYLLSLATIMFSLFMSPVSFSSFFKYTDGKYQEGYDACIKQMKDSKLLMEFHHMTLKQKADICVDILKQHRPDILKIIDIHTFKEGVVKEVYQNNTSEKE